MKNLSTLQIYKNGTKRAKKKNAKRKIKTHRKTEKTCTPHEKKQTHALHIHHHTPNKKCHAASRQKAKASSAKKTSAARKPQRRRRYNECRAARRTTRAEHDDRKLCKGGGFATCILPLHCFSATGYFANAEGERSRPDRAKKNTNADDLLCENLCCIFADYVIKNNSLLRRT
jgi:hypothetical protein